MDLEVSGFVDSKKVGEVYEGLEVYNPDILNPKKHYVIISLVEHESIFAFMENKSYQEEDYVYIEKVTELKKCRHSYQDGDGNTINGSFYFERGGGLCISVASTVFIGKNVTFGDNVTIYLD
ncbi:MAG: hypothetical protein HDT30_06725 [Clostridiales bacterium]|nr:hypothetical protein [Clostridiales bacterium]